MRLTLGEQAVTGARNILMPQLDEWFDGIGDEEVHAAGGPFGRMFMLLAWGCQPMPPPGSQTTGWHCPRVPGGFTGTGPLTAARIWGKAVEALPMGGDYLQTRQVALNATMAMDGYVGGPLMRKVGFAFAAINVGFPPENIPPQATLSCQQVVADLECTGTIADGETPNQSARAPLLVLDGAQTYTMPGWQFTHRFPGPRPGRVWEHGGLPGGVHPVRLPARHHQHRPR